MSENFKVLEKLLLFFADIEFMAVRFGLQRRLGMARRSSGSLCRRGLGGARVRASSRVRLQKLLVGFDGVRNGAVERGGERGSEV